MGSEVRIVYLCPDCRARFSDDNYVESDPTMALRLRRLRIRFTKLRSKVKLGYGDMQACEVCERESRSLKAHRRVVGYEGAARDPIEMLAMGEVLGDGDP